MYCYYYYNIHTILFIGSVLSNALMTGLSPLLLFLLQYKISHGEGFIEIHIVKPLQAAQFYC